MSTPRASGFTAAAVLALALGIASNTAIFSVVHATFLAPLPYHDAEQLVMVWSSNQGSRSATAAADFFEWRRRASAFSDLHVTGMRQVNLAGDDRPEQLRAQAATPGLTGMLCRGEPLAIGRLFLDEEGTPGRDQVVILSHDLWQERFGGDPNVLGQALRIDSKPFTVVGVLGKAPCGHLPWRLTIPRAFSPDQINRDFRNLLVMGRLKPGVSIDQANADMKNVTDALAREFPASNTGWGARVEPLRNNFMNANTKTTLWMLLGAVGFVLLMACANVANLLLARGTARQRELAIRRALGASRGAIVRQLLTESVLLALVGGTLGVGLAAAAMRVILAMMPPGLLPSEVDVRLSVPVLLFTLTASVVSGVLFGLAPAWQAARTDANATLKETARAVGDGRHLLRHALVVVEFALALTLLTGGGLTIHSLIAIARADLGFRSDGLFTFYLPVDDRLKDAGAIETFYRQFAERVRAVHRSRLVANSTLSARFTTILFGAFAFVALLLAAVGIYGVMAFAVAQRTHEIGLRIALGASRAQVVGQILRDGMKMALFGTLIGSAGAYFVVHSMRGIVPGVSPGDPTAFIVVAATLTSTAFVACLLPASRAASVDPMRALRQD